MAGSLLVPLSVSAKVVTADTPVPLLTDKPLEHSGTLQQGIHVHWALPDPLTRARLVKGSRGALFPGVPDLWAVIRFNPVTAIGAKRGWKAWVLDSQTGTVTDLVGWAPPASRDLTVIHAAPGVLEAAGGQAPGWGVWDESQGPFDPLSVAYYPACRTRFGFHDAVADLAGQGGTVNYTVVGWYSSPHYDPLAQASDRVRLLADWQLAHSLKAELYDEISSAVAAGSSSPAVNWMPSSIDMAPKANASPAQLQDIQRAAARGDSSAARMQGLSQMKAGFPAGPPSSGGPAHTMVDVLRQYEGPTSLVCHGAVVNVKLKGASSARAVAEVRLYPSVKRAMADLASTAKAGEAQVDLVEMMLQDLDHQKGTAAGVLDLPGAAHALTFQSVPGKSTRYARLDIHARAVASPAQGYFNLLAYEEGATSGHWPELAQRSASLDARPLAQDIPAASKLDAAVGGPAGPSRDEVTQWVKAVRDAHAACVAAAAAAKTPIHPTLIRVHDHRPNAQSGQLGRTTDGTGTDSAAWWVSADDVVALAELRRSLSGHSAYLPDVANLYEEPGPRWYRPWATQVVVVGGKRSLRFGFDGRFREDGYLQCRRSGEVLLGLAVGASGIAYGRDVASDLGRLQAAGLPAEVRGLAGESLLLDPESSAVMASLTTAPTDDRARRAEQFRNAVRGLWVLRDPKRAAEFKDALEAVLPFGSLPSPIAVTPWEDPCDALFLDTSYSHAHWPLAHDWTLEPEHVELTRRNPPAARTTAVEVITERSPVTATIAKVLKSALFTKQTLNAYGDLVHTSNPPENVAADAFDTADLLSAPLTGLDATLFHRGLRERSGALRVNSLRVVDVFGGQTSWNSGADPEIFTGEDVTAQPAAHLTELTPRLPFWGRLRFRLQAAEGDQEAGPDDSAVCGVLVPDFVEHTLEVFDGAGQPLGELASDPPQRGSEGEEATTLQVRFTLHPWVRATLGYAADDDPFPAITNPTLRALVRSIAAQHLAVPARSDPQAWNETGLTAMLRVIDTVRGTLDPSAKTPDRRVLLTGEPILVLRARFELEGTGADDLRQLTGDPPPLDARVALPEVPVRIGDATRPDDGVLGCFVEGASPAEGRFAPVSAEAAEGAILNVFANNVAGAQPGPSNGVPAAHPFVHGLTSTFLVAPNDPRTYVILADPRGALYATCGVLPRKKVAIPKEFVDAALGRLEPTFRAGPLLVAPRTAGVKVMVPPPQVEGHEAEFVFERNGVFAEAPVSPVPPLGELPTTRVTLTDGWMRVVRTPPA